MKTERARGKSRLRLAGNWVKNFVSPQVQDIDQCEEPKIRTLTPYKNLPVAVPREQVALAR